MLTALTRAASAIRLWYFKLRGADVGPHCQADIGVRLRPGVRSGIRGSIQLGANCELDRGVLLDAWGGSIVLGSRVWIGPYCVVYGHGGVEIGEASLLAMHCRIVSSNHAVPPIGTDIRSQPDELRPTRIGRDVWLGAGVTVLGGVTVGDGCVVGAGAVVTRDLPPGAIAYGVPAEIKGWRLNAPRTP